MRARVMSFAVAMTLAPLPALAVGPPPPPPASADPGKAAPAPGKAAPAPAKAPPTAGGPTAPRGSAAPPPPTTKPAEPGATPEPEVPPADPVDLTGTWTYARGGGIAPRYVRQRDDVDAAPNPEGYYSGVSIEGNHVPPFPAARMGTKPASMTWTGFERVGERSRVFFEVSADVATKLDAKGGVLTLRMVNTKINVRNNARHLDLRYFRTPVRSVKVSRRGRDAVATIVLKRAAEPTVSWIAGKAGYRLLVLDFGPEPEANLEAEAEPPPAP